MVHGVGRKKTVEDEQESLHVGAAVLRDVAENNLLGVVIQEVLVCVCVCVCVINL